MKKTFKAKMLFSICLFCGFLRGLTDVLFPILTKEVIDFASAGQVQNVINRSIWAVIVIVLCIIGANGVSLFQTAYKNELLSQMRMGITNNILKMPLNKLTPNRKAELLAIYNGDIYSVVEQYYINTLDIWELIFTVFFSISALFTLNFEIAAFIIIMNSLKLLNTFLFKKPLEKTYNGTYMTGRSLTAKLSDFLNGINIIRTYKTANIFTKEIKSENDKKNDADLKYQKTAVLSMTVDSILSQGVNFVILFYGAYLILKGNYTAGALFSTIQINSLMSFPFTQISYLVNYRNGAKPLKKELEGLMCDAEPEKKENIFKTTPSIKLQNISFTANDHHILNDINIEFEPNKKYLIVGESGCGKSTLLKIISGIEQNYTGDVIYNDKSQKKLGDKIYNFIRIVFQESYIFQKSIMDNISESRENKVLLDSLISGLKLNKVIDKYKDKIIDEESAQTLSGGEKQRIAIARALYANPQILLLDEVTASLDKETSKDIEEMLLNYKGTVIAVSHTPNAEVINMYDKIITMDSGRIMVSAQ